MFQVTYTDSKTELLGGGVEGRGQLLLTGQTADSWEGKDVPVTGCPTV